MAIRRLINSKAPNQPNNSIKPVKASSRPVNEQTLDSGVMVGDELKQARIGRGGGLRIALPPMAGAGLCKAYP